MSHRPIRWLLSRKRKSVQANYVYPSAYEEEGITTQIDLISPIELKQKMDVLMEMAETGQCGPGQGFTSGAKNRR